MGNPWSTANHFANQAPNMSAFVKSGSLTYFDNSLDQSSLPCCLTPCLKLRPPLHVPRWLWKAELSSTIGVVVSLGEDPPWLPCSLMPWSPHTSSSVGRSRDSSCKYHVTLRDLATSRHPDSEPCSRRPTPLVSRLCALHLLLGVPLCTHPSLYLTWYPSLWTSPAPNIPLFHTPAPLRAFSTPSLSIPW